MFCRLKENHSSLLVADVQDGPKTGPLCCMTEKTMSGVHVSPGSVETLVRWDNKSPYSLSNISAKKYQNPLMCIEVIDL